METGRQLSLAFQSGFQVSPCKGAAPWLPSDLIYFPKSLGGKGLGKYPAGKMVRVDQECHWRNLMGRKRWRPNTLREAEGIDEHTDCNFHCPTSDSRKQHLPFADSSAAI